MLDLQFICDQQELMLENCRNRGVKIALDRIVELRDQRSRLISQGDELRHDQKETSSQIPKASADDRPALIARGKQLREEVAGIEDKQKQVESELRDLQSQVPNVTHPDAPVGLSEDDSVEVRLVGEKPRFDFTPLYKKEGGSTLFQYRLIEKTLPTA